ncbi:MAG: hypothetical protein M0Z65_01000 [Firmicutes bacterium]|uniref:Uncharacterized protein n=1 Tax=Melghirimyces thermohalophilus TaxID=1236220 RepID=A0A1G6I8P3_9BACL|nr:hypothetical protein [Melghirimyces thermohalophilus]MDA8351777.1 hypothetical protein [Bacillota bacterium]SDC02897.1 hypothetical protein SAMN04488112_102118 [Melghirimyces thermohalophilus]
MTNPRQSLQKELDAEVYKLNQLQQQVKNALLRDLPVENQEELRQKVKVRKNKVASLLEDIQRLEISSVKTTDRWC